MSMDLQALAADLQLMLGDCCSGFSPRDLEQQLNTAAQDLARRKWTRKRGTLTLEADQRDYDAPSDLLAPLTPHWGETERARRDPWDSDYPKRLPTLCALDVAGTTKLEISPPPSAEQIADLGSEYLYTYAIRHTLADAAADTTVPEAQRGLLLLRALAEAMKTLAARGVHKPISLGAGGDNRPKNGAPASLADQFMEDFIEGCLA